MQVERHAGVAALGPEWDAVFANGPGLQSGRAWFTATEAAAMPAGAQPLWLAVRDGGWPAALLPLQRVSRRMLTSLTSPYTTAFQPLLAPGQDAVRVGATLGRRMRYWPLVRLEALDPHWPGLAPLLTGLQEAGYVAQTFDHFGNWREAVGGSGWAEYLAARPGALRETIRRRTRAAGRDPTIRIEVTAGEDGLATAMAAYEAVYARSWKEPEPFPAFNATLLPMVARLGMLRMAVLWQGAVPLAAQYWTVADGVATVLKLAHDDGAKALSPGTVLTAHMIQRLIEEEGVQWLDFGRGDDPYKALWTGMRQQRVGVLLASPRRVDGLIEIVRHWAGQVRRRVQGAGRVGG